MTIVMAPLTPRQWEVLRELALGWSYSESAGHLGITPATVRHHVSGTENEVGIYARLGVSSLTEALRAVGWLRVPAP